MHNSSSFKQDISRLRELFTRAPFLEFEDEKKAVLKYWLSELSAKQAKEIFKLSDLYTHLHHQA